jgi:hypothetical protein
MKARTFYSDLKNSTKLVWFVLIFPLAFSLHAQPDLLNVMENGNVGIGISLPQFPLDISSNQGVLRMVTTTHTNGSVIDLKSTVASPTFLGAVNFNNTAGTTPGQIAYTGGNAMTFKVNGSERLRISPNGYVGIGTATPNDDLHVANHIRVGEDASYSTVYGELKHDGGSTGFIINANASGGWADMYLQTDGITRMFIESAGNVGIGTTTLASGYRLSVSGKVMCEELKVQLQGSWPDYVFTEGYNLKALSTLEREIRNLGHLPGMPSALEVAKNGVEVGEIQRLLLEKMEELTLYVIALKKENEAIKDELVTLKTQQRW